MDEYYMIAASDNERFAELHDPLDATGRPFPDFQGIASTTPATCRCVDGRTRLADCVYSVSTFYISERAVEVFRRFHLPEKTAFLPVDVLTRDDKPLGKVVAVLLPEIVDVVDLAASQYKELTRGIPHYFTAPPVVRAGTLGGLDFLMGFHVHYLCSGELRREIEKEKLTNFAFEPVVLK